MALQKIITRELKGAPLTADEMDANFITLQQSIVLNVPQGFEMYTNWSAHGGAGELVFDTSAGTEHLNLFNSMGNATLHIGSTQEGKIDLRNSVEINKTINDGKAPFVINFGNTELFKIDSDGNAITLGKMVGDMLVIRPQDIPAQVEIGGVVTNGEDLYIGLSI